MKGKYLLMTGAPGSRWSGVANRIHASVDFDQTDDTEERSFSHHNGLIHGGAYFDPMMEFENSRKNWDKPFMKRGGSTGYPRSMSTGIRLIKSHTFAYKLETLKEHPIVMVLRNDYECLTWWLECGGFDIPYPNYAWYKNEDQMFTQIQLQNQAITTFIYKNRDKVIKCKTNWELLDVLGLDSSVTCDGYDKKDVSVYVYQP
jgi:hypothetical protein